MAGETRTASVPETAGATYSWSIQNGTITSGGGSRTVTFQAGCRDNVILTVSVSKNCPASSSKSIPVTVSTAVVSGTQSVPQGGSAAISAALTGTAPWTLTWSDGLVESNITGSPHSRPVTPAQTTTYTATVVDGNGCAGSASGEAVVTVTPPAPQLTATAAGRTQVDVWWTFAGAADRFDLYRNGTLIYSGQAFSYADVAVQQETAYWYQVRAVKGGTASPDSNRDVATTIVFEDATLAPRAPIRAQHVLQLRTAINAVRAVAGLPAVNFDETIAPGALIRAVQMTKLRTGLDEARAQLLLPAVTYTRPAVATGMGIQPADVMDLRGGVQ